MRVLVTGGLGIRRVAFAVDDLDAAVAGLHARGAELVGGWSATTTATGCARSAARSGSSSCLPSSLAEAPSANRLRRPRPDVPPPCRGAVDPRPHRSERLTGVRHHPAWVWALLHYRLGWSVQGPVRRAAERDQDAIDRWGKERWSTVMAAALCDGVRGGGAQLAFHVTAGTDDPDSLIGVVEGLPKFLAGEKATLR
jgi:hypothetical protein